MSEKGAKKYPPKSCSAATSWENWDRVDAVLTECSTTASIGIICVVLAERMRVWMGLKAAIWLTAASTSRVTKVYII